MADAKLTALTAASALAAADLFYVSQSAASRKATGTQLLALVGTAYVPLAGGTMTGALTIASGTLTVSAPALSITQTWNGVGQRFDAFVMDITNTNSSNSYPMIIRVGGTEQMYLTKTGDLYAQNLRVLTNTGVLGYGSDLFLLRDAAATLAQRNGTTAQTLRVYRSYTDGSNYSRFTHGWNTSTALLMAEGLGTGTDGNIAFNDAALATGATLGYIMVPSAAGVSTGVPADIPTGQTPIVFDSTNKKIGAYTGGAWVWTAALA
jgi:hypothetical protein